MEDSKLKQMTHFELVGEFHDTFGHPQRKEPYNNCYEVEPKLIPFRISLIREETNEFKDAYTKKDLVEMADALADLSYVINGAGQCVGINLDDLAKEHDIDLNTPYNIKKHEPRIDLVSDKLELLEDSISSFIVKTTCDDKLTVNKIGEYLLALLIVTYDLGHKLGFDMDLIFREVHRSNMTKVCSTMEDAEASVKFYENEGRYKQPSIRKKGNYYVVFDAATSKILKNHKWETPNIKQFLKSYTI
jgi:predicted HAD superfamily Cof-like phosphohydrolase